MIPTPAETPVTLTWPPVEQGTIADDFWLLSECDTAVAERLVKALDAVEATIGEPTT